MGNEWKVALIVLAALLVGAVLAGGGRAGGALAQSEGSAGNLICVMGSPFSNEAPIVLVDVLEQTLLVYRYRYSNSKIELRSVRSFRHDRGLRDWNTDGVTVNEVAEHLRQQAAGGARRE